MSFCVAGAALSTCRVAYFLRIALSRLREVVTLTTPRFTLYTPTFALPLYTLHSTSAIPHFTRYTLHSTLSTLNSAPHTLHSTLYTLHFTFFTSRSTLYTPHFTLILFSHNYDSGIRFPTCGHSGSWVSSCLIQTTSIFQSLCVRNKPRPAKYILNCTDTMIHIPSFRSARESSQCSKKK